VTYYIHVNRGKIDSNRKHGRDEPVITIKKGKHGKPSYAKEIAINGPVRVLSSMSTPILPCGARLVIMTETKPEIIE
jgi:hypothetical protein